jgi:FAD/FMN-containing dehydrogenase
LFLRALKAMKGELDPGGILNPGVLVEAGGAAPEVRAT